MAARQATNQSWVLSEAKVHRQNSARSLAATTDGKVLMGYRFTSDGLEEWSVDGIRIPKLTGVLVENVSVLPDGRSVVRDHNRNISLYSRQWVEIKETVFHRFGKCAGGMDVDGSNQIYVGCIDDDDDNEVICVYNPEGGEPVRKILCHGYKPYTVCCMNHSEMLVLSDKTSVKVVDRNGEEMHDNIRKEGCTAHVAVLQDDNILIGWWSQESSVVSVDLYTNQLRLDRNVLCDYPVRGEVVAIKQLSTGEIAMCDSTNLYIFQKNST